jgi:hypothetical protein
MSKNDDEFKDVVRGLPSDNTTQKSIIKFAAIFLTGGIIITILVILFGDSLRYMFTDDDIILLQILMNGSISLLIGILQAWIFKTRIKSRLYAFIFFSLLGGVIGGLIGGILINSGIDTPLMIGAVNGVLAGGISSLAQNKLMGNKKYGMRWFLYNTVSWGVIFSIAWTIAWEHDTDTLTLALTSGFLMIASGISLVAFLRNTPQIEFS